MMMNDPARSTGKARKKGLAFAHIVFMLSIAVVLILAAVMVGTRAGMLSIATGFELITLSIAPRVVMVLAALSLLSLLISLFKAPVKYGPWALAACVITFGLLIGYYVYEQALKTLPPIAEASTNWDEPVTFSDKLTYQRGRDARPITDLSRVPRSDSLEWGGRTVAEINELTCPAAKGITRVEIDEDQAAAILAEQGITVFGKSPWRVEGTYQDDFFGFQYDVVVRIDPTRIDVRAVSRQNFPDLGASCRIVTRVVQAIKKD